MGILWRKADFWGKIFGLYFNPPLLFTDPKQGGVKIHEIALMVASDPVSLDKHLPNFTGSVNHVYNFMLFYYTL